MTHVYVGYRWSHNESAATPFWRWLDNDKQSCRSVLWNKYPQYLTTVDRFHARTDLEDTCALKGVGIALGTIRKVGEAEFRHFLSVGLDQSQTSQCDDGLSVITNQNQILVLFYRFEPPASGIQV